VTGFPILLDSNGPWLASGYGQQTALLAERLKADGHDVAIACMTGLNGQPQYWKDILCLPVGLVACNNDIIGEHARHFFAGRPGLVLALYDAWCLDPGSLAGLATAVWTPVHSDKLSAGDRGFFKASRALPIAMSQHGVTAMRNAGLDPYFAPHGIDCGVFRPLDDAERAEARDRLTVPQDAFLVTMVAANKGTSPARKAFGENLAAFAAFRGRHPEARLFLHTMARSPYGLDLVPLLDDLGLMDCTHISDMYGQVSGVYTPTYVARLLGCSDVGLMTSYGEGFGLPAMECQAAGVPVIVGDNSAQPEYLGAGWAAECQPYWQPDDEAWWATPLVRSVGTALDRAWRTARNPGLRQRARAFAEQYDADLVYAQYWKPLVEMLAQYAGAAPVSAGRGGLPLPTAESDGLRWIQRGGHTDDWIATGHEEWLEPVLTGMLPEGGVFLDVGAHVGRWSLRMAKRASAVIAVEANPATAAVLRAHLELNQVANVEVLNVAAWDEVTRLRLDDPNRRVAGGSTRVLPAGLGDGDGTVPAVPLDHLLASEPRIDLVKLDVEGADLRALTGMAGTLDRLRPKLLIERHDIYGYYKLAELTGMLDSLGYAHSEVNIVLKDGAVAPYLAAEPKPAGE